ncbi:MAG: proteasome assembly chaperone family protein [Nanobdellota archaeon]
MDFPVCNVSDFDAPVELNKSYLKNCLFVFPTMAIELSKKPHNPIIVQGFPGFGLVGTITTEFLIRHCKCELIGRKWFEELPAALAIHNGDIINPIGIYYNEEYNLVIIHSISAGQGIEWKMADFLQELGDELEAKEFLCLEGVASTQEHDVPSVYYYTTDQQREEYLKDKGLSRLNEGVMMGVTPALMLKTKRQLSSLFVESHSEYPDSKGAAELIKALDKVLNLKIDPEPLLESAKKFEKNFNKIIEQSQTAQKISKKKQLDYLG